MKVLLCLSIFLASCSYHVVGDSTMVQIESVNGGTGSTLSSAGFTESASAGRIPLTPPEKDVVILAVSVNDRNATDLSGYSDAHDYYLSFDSIIIWVEVPTFFVGHPYHDILVDLNVNVAVLLGCTLAPEEIRYAETVDGVHYTDEGAIQVAIAFESLAINPEIYACS